MGAAAQYFKDPPGAGFVTPFAIGSVMLMWGALALYLARRAAAVEAVPAESAGEERPRSRRRVTLRKKRPE